MFDNRYIISRSAVLIFFIKPFSALEHGDVYDQVEFLKIFIDTWFCV